MWTRLENLPAHLNFNFSVDTPGESSCSLKPLLQCGHAWRIFLLSYTSASVWTRLENLPAQLHLRFSVDTPGESSCSVTPPLQCGHAWRIFLLSYTSASVWTRLGTLPAQLHLRFSVDTPGNSSCSVTPPLQCGQVRLLAPFGLALHFSVQQAGFNQYLKWHMHTQLHRRTMRGAGIYRFPFNVFAFLSLMVIYVNCSYICLFYTFFFFFFSFF